MPDTEPGTVCGSSYTLRTFDLSAVREYVPDWHQLEKTERSQLTRHLLTIGALRPIPKESHSGTNATLGSLHREIARLLSIRSATDFERLGDPPTHVALGTGASTPQSSQRALDEQVGRIRLTDPGVVGAAFTARETIGSLELTKYNGSDKPPLREWGVQCASGRLRNRGVFNQPIERSTDENHQLQIRIPIGDVEQVQNGRIVRSGGA
jgi:hypothetical protein